MSTTAPPAREHLADEVVRCIDASDLRAGLAACQKLNRSFPEYAYGWYLASFLMRRARNTRDALRAIDRALAIDATDRYRLHRARCLFDSGDVAACADAASALRAKRFEDAALHSELAMLLHQLNEHAASLEHYTHAIGLEPGKAEHHFNRAAVLRYLGEVEAAEAAFDRTLELDPDRHEACNARAQLRRQTPARNHVAELRAAIARTRDGAGLVQLHYALAKELEDLAEYPASFESLQNGARLRRRHMRYNVQTDLQILDAIRATYDRVMFERGIEGCPAIDPIFVIGMPRTGTTLVERILASHSQVESAGELNTFGLELTRLVREAGRDAGTSRTAFVASSARIDFAALGEAYLEATRIARHGRPRFIDKLPFNFLYAGLIHLALPRARIVCLEREPLDTCYAVYKQLFRDAYPFSYDQDELAQYYIAYHRLMQHWHAVLPGRIHTVHYEQLVGEPEPTMRALLEYCGLEWEDACLRFHENRAASTTASAVQVRQPLYRSSVAMWRHYATELEPLRARLRDAGIAAD